MMQESATQKSLKTRFPTPEENIALSLIFEWLGESPINRTMEEYMDIASRLPPLKVLHGIVEQRLRKLHTSGQPLYEICDFRKGDRSHWYRPFPKRISLETIRTALNVSGMREPRWSKRSTR
jgi:hypothetical protein